MKNHEDISFDNVQDPVGLANFVKEAKKLFKGFRKFVLIHDGTQ